MVAQKPATNETMKKPARTPDVVVKETTEKTQTVPSSARGSSGGAGGFMHLFVQMKGLVGFRPAFVPFATRGLKHQGCY